MNVTVIQTPASVLLHSSSVALSRPLPYHQRPFSPVPQHSLAGLSRACSIKHPALQTRLVPASVSTT